MTTATTGMFNSRLLLKLLGVVTLVIIAALAIVWLAIDFFALSYFSSLLDQYHVPQKRDVMDMFLQSAHHSLVYAGLAALAAALIIGLFLLRMILEPLHQMLRITGKVAKGEYGSRVAISSNDEISELANAFNAMTANLERIETLRKKMVVDVAHELRTPLTNIRGYLEALRDGVIAPDNQIFDSLHEETLRLASLSEGLMRLSGADAARLTLQRELVDLQDLFAHTLLLFEAQFAGKGIVPETRLTESARPILADSDKLAQVIHNLLHNAWQYTPRGGTIHVSVEERDGMIRTVVANSGEPIAKEHLELIFERFYRVDPSRSRELGGAGIGLAIVKELVEAHGGRVGAESAAGENRFWFSLPAER